MAIDEVSTVLEPRPLPNFVETPAVAATTERALGYSRAGFAVHFRGGTGTGKTTLALHVASKIGRPVVMIHGDEEYSTSDMVGGQYGYKMKKVVDNFIHSVLKTEETMQRQWVDNRLTVACKYGFTHIYDEFTRSRPEANNILLSILQEKMLDLPAARQSDESYLRVHPNFTPIFTSNPEEYAGTFRSADALRDRMVTMDLTHFDEETEVAITQAKSGLPRSDALRIVRIVRGLRDSGLCEFAPTVRGCLIVGKTLRMVGATISADDGSPFREICKDVLSSETTRLGVRSPEVLAEIDALVDRLAGGAVGEVMAAALIGEASAEADGDAVTQGSALASSVPNVYEKI